MPEPQRITYLTDDPTPAYNAGITGAKSPAALVKFLERWPNLAPDALKAARGLTAEDWTEWRRGLALERKGKFAGEDWAGRFAVILMPERMIRASMVADQFAVPWGLAWKRLRETEPRAAIHQQDTDRAGGRG